MADGRGNKCAHGYWGRSTWERLQAEGTATKIQQNLYEKLLTTGQRVSLWLPVTDGIPCSCKKDTTKTSDRPCTECYGTGFSPGFEKFLHETVFFGVSEALAYTLTDCSIDFAVKPNRILMDAGATTCTIVTDDKPYSNSAADAWEVRLDAYIRATGNTVSAEFSTDAGSTWSSITVINGANKPTGNGNIRFRITMTRSSASTRSPAFEIIRARHVRSDDAVADIRSDLLTGELLILRPWIQEQSQSDTGRGITVEWMGDRSWTMPLDVFDSSITPETPAARISDRDPGPHPFYRYQSGIKTDDAVVLTSFKWNEEFGLFTHQSFDERRAQVNEKPYSMVW